MAWVWKAWEWRIGSGCDILLADLHRRLFANSNARARERLEGLIGMDWVGQQRDVNFLDASRACASANWDSRVMLGNGGQRAG